MDQYGITWVHDVRLLHVCNPRLSGTGTKSPTKSGKTYQCHMLHKISLAPFLIEYYWLRRKNIAKSYQVLVFCGTCCQNSTHNQTLFSHSCHLSPVESKVQGLWWGCHENWRHGSCFDKMISLDLGTKWSFQNGKSNFYELSGSQTRSTWTLWKHCGSRCLWLYSMTSLLAAAFHGSLSLHCYTKAV